MHKSISILPILLFYPFKDLLVKEPRPSLIWTDQKTFTVQRVFNHQNDCVYAVNFEDIPEGERTMFVQQHPAASVMVWVNVTDCGKNTIDG